MVLGGPAAHVGADLGNELERAIGREAIDLGQVRAGQVVQDGPDVKVGFVAMPAGDARGWQGRGRRRDRGGEGLKLGFDRRVAGHELRLTHIKKLEVLLEDEEVFRLVVSGQGGDDLLGGGLAVRVAVLGEDVRVALVGDEGPEDREPVLPTMSLTTRGSRRFIWVSAFCMRCT